MTIGGLRGVGELLARCDFSELLTDALANAAAKLEAEVKDAVPSGAVDQSRSSSLQDSIKRSANAGVAVVGSDDPAAVARELGTHDAPPRPIFALIASRDAERIVRSIAISISDMLGASLD